MSEERPNNVVDFAEFKRQREAHDRHFNNLIYFEMKVSGDITFDELDELASDLMDEDLEVEVYVYPEEAGDDDIDDRYLPANDQD